MKSHIYNLFIRNLFFFRGRASRKEYIYRILFVIFLLFINRDLNRYTLHHISAYLVVLKGILVILQFVYMFQYFPLAVRRLHDLNLSGFCVIVSFVPFGLLLMLLLIFKKGTDGVNDYGEPPEY